MDKELFDSDMIHLYITVNNNLNGNLMKMRSSDIIDQFKQSSDRNAKLRLDIYIEPE